MLSLKFFLWKVTVLAKGKLQNTSRTLSIIKLPKNFQENWTWIRIESVKSFLLINVCCKVRSLTEILWMHNMTHYVILFCCPFLRILLINQLIYEFFESIDIWLWTGFVIFYNYLSYKGHIQSIKRSFLIHTMIYTIVWKNLRFFKFVFTFYVKLETFLSHKGLVYKVS